MRHCLLLLAVAACAEPVIEMRLGLPQQVPQGFDLQCVTAVDVAAHRTGVPPFVDIGQRDFILNINDPCIPITPQTTFEGIRDQLRGQVSFDLGDDLEAIQIRGRAGGCNDDQYHESIFYGGALFDGGDVTLDLVPNISCDAKTTYKVRPFELIEALSSAGHTYQPITDNRRLAFAGVIRPSKLEPVAAPIAFEGGTGFGSMDATGIATVPGFASTMSADACIALGFSEERIGGGTCANTGGLPLFGAAGEIELPIFPFPLVSSVIDEAAFDEVGSFVLGTVWDTNPAAPVAGATVTVPEGVKLDYISLTATGSLEVIRGGTTTDASGLFMLYTPKVVDITIAAPDHQSRTLRVGGGFELPGVALAVLPKL